MSAKPKKGKSRPPASHHLSTPSHPSSAFLSSAPSFPSLTLFSPSAAHLAHVSLALDKVRLRISDVKAGGRTEVEWDGARGEKVGRAEWVELDLTAPGDAGGLNGVDPEPPTKKRRRKSKSASDPHSAAQPLLALSLSHPSPAIHIFSPSHPSPLRTLTHAGFTAPATALAAYPGRKGWLVSGHADGTVRMWDVGNGLLMGSYASVIEQGLDANTALSALAVLPSPDDAEEEETKLLVGTHRILLLSLPPSTSPTTPLTPTVLTTYPGHASPISSLLLLPSSNQFITIASDDRFLQVWNLPAAGGAEGALVSSLPMPSPCRAVSLSPSSPAHLLALSARTLFLLPLPLARSPTDPSKKRKSALQALEPASSISIVSGKRKRKASEADGDADAGEGVGVEMAAAAFEDGGTGRVVLCSLAGGVKPVFESIQYLDEEDAFIPEISVSSASLSANLLASTSDEPTGPSQTRYAEPASLAVSSGLAAEGGDDDLPELNGDLDVNLAEMSLGERLATTMPSRPQQPAAVPSSSAPTAPAILPVPASSLSRTLTQALHSSDLVLLESCLAHRKPALITATVQRLPPQLAVALLNACVERLARGAGGAASAERAQGLVEWVRAVLVCHTAYLLTIPDIISRLSGLYSVLSARLAMHPRLLTLSGRLDLVLAQLDLREANQAEAAPRVAEKTQGGKKEGNRYVEGESEEEEEEEGVRVEKGEEEGSVEDIELGGEDDDDDDDAEDEEGEGEELEDVEMDGDGDEDEEEEDEEFMPNGIVDHEDEEDEWGDEEEESEDE